MAELLLAAWLSVLQADPAPSPDPGGPDASEEASPHTPAGHKIVEPKNVKRVAPEWPKAALRAGLDGRVILECTIGTDGHVEDVKVLRGYHSLGEATAAAVRKWRYTTTTLDGKAVPVIMTVTANFKLEKPPNRDDLLESLRDPDPEIRWAAVRWLGRFRPVMAKQRAAIEEALHDPSELVRSSAADALAKLDGSK